jgi:hypothetical protein
LHGQSLYRLAYLVDQNGIVQEQLLTPARLEQTLSVHTVSSVAEARQWDEIDPLDGLVIHNSALPMIDRDWLRQLYRRRTVIVVFNLETEGLAQLLGDPRIVENGQKYGRYSLPFFTVVQTASTGVPNEQGTPAGSCLRWQRWPVERGPIQHLYKVKLAHLR